MFNELNSIFHKHMVSHVAEHDPLFNTYSEHYIKAKQYGQGDYVKEHDDCGNVKLKGKIHHVAYSCLLYLNNSHGGELVVNGEEIEITKGTFIIFPAEILHAVNTIISGKRHCVLFRLFREIK